MLKAKQIALLAAVGAIGAAGHAFAQAAPQSDLMVIKGTSTGATYFGGSIPEVSTAPEPSLVFGGGTAPVPLAVPAATIGTLPGVNVVFLTEPAGSTPD